MLPESGGSANADSIAHLYLVVLVIAGLIFVAVTGSLVYFLFRYRKRRGQAAAQIHGNTQLEIAWTTGAGLILVALAVLTFFKLEGIITPTPAPAAGHALHIKVTGRQYLWRYDYPNGAYSYERLVVPADTTVVLDLTSIDVNHSWWVPKLGGKADAIRGYTNHTWFKAPHPAVYSGQCAELCGEHHAEMIATVQVVPQARYTAWVARQKRLIHEARQLLAKQRKQMLRNGELE